MHAKLAATSTVQDWNQATNLVITDQAGGQIMGDWAQGEFQVAGEVAGTDYTCLPGIGINEYISTGRRCVLFPEIDDADIEAAQLRLAALLVSPEVQVAFNLKKGSLPIRGDVDLAAANDCMKKGLAILAGGNIVPAADMVWSPDVAEAERRPDGRILEIRHEPGRCAGAVGRNPEVRSLKRLTAPPETPGGSLHLKPGRVCAMATPGGPPLFRNLNAKIAAMPMVLTTLVVFLGGTIWTMIYSFTNSKLLPKLSWVGSISTSACGAPALAGLD